jgi:hypothetical protein
MRKLCVASVVIISFMLLAKAAMGGCTFTVTISGNSYCDCYWALCHTVGTIYYSYSCEGDCPPGCTCKWVDKDPNSWSASSAVKNCRSGLALCLSDSDCDLVGYNVTYGNPEDTCGCFRN